jgi:formate-nitrite transporter family protein
MELTSDTKFVISILVATVLVIGGGAFLASRKAPDDAGTVVADSLVNRLVKEDSAFTGPQDAKVTFVEFGDFQCPSCGAIYPLLKDVKEKYKDQSVRFVFRHFPLPQHENAFLSAEAAVAAYKQNKFWQYHDILFENQLNLKKDDLIAYAEKAELDMNAFKEALDTHANEALVKSDMADGSALGIRGTPTLFINNIQYNGKYSLDALSSAIDAELAK